MTVRYYMLVYTEVSSVGEYNTLSMQLQPVQSQQALVGARSQLFQSPSQLLEDNPAREPIK